MQRILLILLTIAMTLPLTGCWKCYECTAETNDGPLTRDVCGRNRDIRALIQELENDTVGVGPWVCE